MEMATEGANFQGKIQSSILDIVNLSIRQLGGESPAMTEMILSYMVYKYIYGMPHIKVAKTRHRISNTSTL